MLSAEEKKVIFVFKSPEVMASSLGEDFGMGVKERNELSGELAAFAANYLIKKKGDKDSIDFTTKALGLAFQLNPRNRKLLVVNGQLKKGILPNRAETTYTKEAFAVLLVRRAEILLSQKGKKNFDVARAMVALAASIDPRNEDAVFAFEIQKIDYGKLSWGQFTDGSHEKKAP